MSAARMWIKCGLAGALVCIGGPALVIYVTPTEEELFKRYNPELQKRSLENRQGRQQEFDDFVGRLKEYSKSDKPIWEVAAEDEARRRAEQKTRLTDEIQSRHDEIQKRRDEIRRHATNPD
ncbi:assembly factor cbp4 [Trapelia coarctata]|nr:assembly factor cbp4 [Trapelia coarctata]